MPRVLKNIFPFTASDYVLRPAEELKVSDQAQEETPKREEEGPEKFLFPLLEEDEPELEPEEEEEEEQPREEEDPIAYARVQAKAILEDARREAEREIEEWKAREREAFQRELEQEREGARQEGYDTGYAEGMGHGMREARAQRDELVNGQIKTIERFMEQAAREKAKILEDSREELKDLALAIAEKVIRVSLKNSSDILLRMVDAATDTHKRCEWARIYVADCDLTGKAYTTPELTEALGHISERVRIVPMPDEESGTCIIELPDVILDASVSTQLGAIKEVLDSTALDKN